MDSTITVTLTEDEAKALTYAARRCAALLRAEGWKDMLNNALILDTARDKIEEAERVAS